MQLYKHILCVILSLFIFNFGYPQLVTLNSQADVDNFDPNTTIINGNLNITGGDIVDISNLSNIHTITKGIWIKHTSLVNLDALSNLSYLGNYQFEDYAPFSVISYNPLLQNIDGLSGLSFIDGGIEIKDNPNLTNLNGFINITYIDGGFTLYNNDALTNLGGLYNLTTINSFIVIGGNDSLENLNGLNNLQYISLGNPLPNQNLFNIFDNSSLSDCCGVNYLLQSIDPLNFDYYVGIGDNLPGCNSKQEIIQTCLSTVIQGTTYWDINTNGSYDSGDIPLNSGIDIAPNAFSTYSTESIYSSYIPNPGDYTIAYHPLPNWQLNSDSSSYHVSISEGDTLTGFDFGFIPTDTITALESNINSSLTICDRFVPFTFSWQNTGTTIIDATTSVIIDSSIDSISFEGNLPDALTTQNIFQWQLENILPTQTVSKTIILRIPGVDDEFPLGDSIHVDMNTIYESTNIPNVTQGQNLTDYSSVVLCSYDPNDKLVSPDRTGEENLTLFGEPLIYTIRFQNTGNYYAENIIIRDTLDDNLDPNTFRVLNSSHSEVLETTMESDQYLTFSFNNIMLPDSSLNFDASQGYVSFIIEPYDGLPEGTTITNTAHIYFDTNPTIVTNNTNNTLTQQIVNHLSLTACDFMAYNGEVYEETTSIDGDTTFLYDGFIIDFVDISINYSSIEYEDIEINLGESYTLPNGNIVSSPGVYQSDLLSVSNCDSIIITNLQLATSTEDLSIEEFHINIYPNPFTNEFTIELEDNEITGGIEIYNTLSQKIKQKELSSKTIISTEHWSKGVYFIIIYDHQGKMIGSKRLLKT